MTKKNRQAILAFLTQNYFSLVCHKNFCPKVIFLPFSQKKTTTTTTTTTKTVFLVKFDIKNESYDSFPFQKMCTHYSNSLKVTALDVSKFGLIHPLKVEGKY